MSLDRYRNDNPRSEEELADAIETELQSVQPNAAPAVRGTQNFAYIMCIAETLAERQEKALSELYNAGYIADASGEELTKLADDIGVKRRSPVSATGVAKFSRSTNATTDYTIPTGTRVSTGGDNSEVFETTEKTTINNGTKEASANIKAVETGPAGNVGANTIVVLVDKPSGVENVTNPNPTGDPTYTLTDGTTQLTVGRDEEDDKTLRDRALDSTAVGGAGSVQALELALENIDEVISADVYTNRNGTTQNNVDPWKTEIRVYNGKINDIADVLYDVLPVATLKSLQGGANGTKEQTTINKGDLLGTTTVEITRPTEIALEITVDFVHNAAYGGDNDVKNAIVDYIGGTRTDSVNVPGIGQNEDVIVNEVENVVEDVAGVEAVTSSLIDNDSDGNDDTTTDSDGVQVLAVGGSEVPVIDAPNITLNKTAR